MKNIVVIGNYSGRNAGDAAILGALFEDISQLYPDVSFQVPTLNCRFIRQTYANYRVQAISLMPWHLSAKIFGVPIFHAIAQADLVLVTDAILFDHKLYDPLYNYLSTLTLALPFAKWRGIPVVLYNVSIGPITSALGKWCLRQVLESTELTILRDDYSCKLLESLQLTPRNLHVAADCALNTRPCEPSRLDEIIQTEGCFANPHGTITFNINRYIDLYVRGTSQGIGRNRFVTMIANTVDQVIDELNVDVLFVVTQHMDLNITQDAIARVRRADRVQMVSNYNYSYQELAGLLSKADLHVGVRTHSLILASAMGVPVVGLNYRPKNRGFLGTIGREQYGLEFSDFSVEHFYALIVRAWEERVDSRAKIAMIIDQEKQKSRDSAALLEPFLRP